MGDWMQWPWKAEQFRRNARTQEADCGIVACKDGHGYAVFRCPRFMDRKSWRTIAKRTLAEHEACAGIPTADLAGGVVAKRELERLVKEAYDEGFMDGKDHANLSQCPPLAEAWAQSLAKQSALRHPKPTPSDGGEGER